MDLKLHGQRQHTGIDVLQVCCETYPTIDPDTRDVNKYTEDITTLKEYIGKYWPSLNSEPAIKETCIYTVSESALCALHHTLSHTNF